MELDWVKNLLPILNSTGVPLLSIGVIMLIRAYHKSVSTYKETSQHLTCENERLTKRLRDMESLYFEKVDKMREMVTKAEDAMVELQARKIALLSGSHDSDTASLIADVRKINTAIELIQELARTSTKIEKAFRDSTNQLQDELDLIQRNFESLRGDVSRIIDEIGDTKSRTLVLGVLATNEAAQKIVSGEFPNKRGIAINEVGWGLSDRHTSVNAISAWGVPNSPLSSIISNNSDARNQASNSLPLSSKSKCPGCGENISETSSCPNCGTHIEHGSE